MDGDDSGLCCGKVVKAGRSMNRQFVCPGLIIHRYTHTGADSGGSVVDPLNGRVEVKCVGLKAYQWAAVACGCPQTKWNSVVVFGLIDEATADNSDGFTAPIERLERGGEITNVLGVECIPNAEGIIGIEDAQIVREFPLLKAFKCGELKECAFSYVDAVDIG